MRSVIIKEKQTLFDIALQEMGEVDAVFEIARLNDLSPSAVLGSGTIIQIPDDAYDEDVVTEYSGRKWRPSTGDDAVDNILGGIDYMGIEIDFIVS